MNLSRSWPEGIINDKTVREKNMAYISAHGKCN